MAAKLVACTLLVSCAVAVVNASLAQGGIAPLFGFPLAVGLVLAGLRVARGPLRIAPRWLVGASLLALAAGLVLALAGAGLAGWLCAALAAGAIATGAWISLAVEPPPGASASGVAPVLLIGAACDEAGRATGEIAARLFSRWSIAGMAGGLRAAVDRYRERGWLEEPSRAHPQPPGLESPSLETARVRGMGRCTHLRFDSGYEPYDPEVRDWYLGLADNRTAHAFLWRHGGMPRPTVVCLHGYLMGHVGFDARVFEVRRLYEQEGLDVVLASLPLHGPRSVGRWSGAGLLVAHPLALNAMLGQAVWDLRRLCAWLRAEGAPALGLYGMSLGGYLAALLASLEDGISCVVPAIPLASFGSLIWRDYDDRERRAHAATGIDEAFLEDLFAPNAPLRLRPRVPPRGRLVVAAAADRICPPDQAVALWEHWSRPAIWWSPCSHLLPFRLAAERARIAAHLRESLVGRAP